MSQLVGPGDQRSTSPHFELQFQEEALAGGLPSSSSRRHSFSSPGVRGPQSSSSSGRIRRASCSDLSAPVSAPARASQAAQRGMRVEVADPAVAANAGFHLYVIIDRQTRIPLVLTPQEQQTANAQDGAIKAALGRVWGGPINKWDYHFNLNHGQIVYWDAQNQEHVFNLEAPPNDKQVQATQIKDALKILEDIHVQRRNNAPLYKTSWKEGTLGVSSRPMGGTSFKVISKKNFHDGAELAKQHLQTRPGVLPVIIQRIEHVLGAYDVLRSKTEIKRNLLKDEINILKEEVKGLRNNANRTNAQDNRLQTAETELNAKENEIAALNAFLKSLEDCDGYAIAMAVYYKNQINENATLTDLTALVDIIHRDIQTSRQQMQGVFSFTPDVSKDKEYATLIAGLVLELHVEELTVHNADEPLEKGQRLMAGLFQGLEPPSGIEFHLISLLYGNYSNRVKEQIASALNWPQSSTPLLINLLVRPHTAANVNAIREERNTLWHKISQFFPG